MSFPSKKGTVCLLGYVTVGSYDKTKDRWEYMGANDIAWRRAWELRKSAQAALPCNSGKKNLSFHCTYIVLFYYYVKFEVDPIRCQSQRKYSSQNLHRYGDNSRPQCGGPESGGPHTAGIMHHAVLLHDRLPIVQCHAGIYQECCELGTTAPIAHLVSPFVAVDSVSGLSFLTFACLLHARLNPSRQNPWSIVPQHGPLVYVRRCL